LHSLRPKPEACPYANICEQCDNFVPAPENRQVLAGQLTDIRALHIDARTRGWDTEAARHATIIGKLEAHLATLDRVRTPDANLLTRPHGRLIERLNRELTAHRCRADLPQHRGRHPARRRPTGRDERRDDRR
jgi:hypothetical protein